ncbi:MAG: IPExxxVDY family protein [Bacteroidetes bacterium]|nr:IPExxxVDY family protein [Bacteroidota bacterium]
MAKHKLFAEDDYEFELIGICSNNSDYRLCWNINQCLQIGLSKGDDYSLLSKKDGESFHSFYQFTDADDLTEYYLIKNVSNTYKHLIPEKDQVDYFLVIKNNTLHAVDDILTALRSNESILTAFIFDPDELKSKPNLLF